MTIDRIPTNHGNVPLRRSWKGVGPERVQAVCERAGLGYESFKHVAAGRRAMSPNVAAHFVKASGGKLKLEQLIFRPGARQVRA